MLYAEKYTCNTIIVEGIRFFLSMLSASPHHLECLELRRKVSTDSLAFFVVLHVIRALGEENRAPLDRARASGY